MNASIETDANVRDLANRALNLNVPENTLRERTSSIHRRMLAESPYLGAPDFRVIHEDDLRRLFGLYDAMFFDRGCELALGKRLLTFRLAPRMLRTGGTTTRFRDSTGEERFEIAIGTSLLFNTFKNASREVTVCGLACSDRLEALQRIMEHEMIHLIEQVCWGKSNCSAAPFQSIARRFFAHQAHTHNLVTQRELAAQAGVKRGSRVKFQFDGQQLTGRVNRVTRRATVLVEDPAGAMYSDGGRYKTYYVPLSQLEVIS